MSLIVNLNDLPGEAPPCDSPEIAAKLVSECAIWTVPGYLPIPADQAVPGQNEYFIAELTNLCALAELELNGEIGVSGNGVSIADNPQHTPADAALTNFTKDETHTFTINNFGGEPLTLGSNAVTISGADAANFSVTAQPPATIAPKSSASFQIRFARVNEGPLEPVDVTISSDDKDEGLFNFRLSSTSEASTEDPPTPQTPEIGLTGKGVSIADNPDYAPTETTDTDFGNAEIGTSVTKTYTVTNSGTQSLILGADAVTISGANASDFTVSVQPEATVAPTSSTTFDITFSPSSYGSSGPTDIAIASNDADESPYNFRVRGTAVSATSAQVITSATIKEFIEQRARQIVSNQTDLTGRLRNREPSGERAGNALGYATEDSSKMSLSASLNEIEAWQANKNGDPAPAPRDLDVWIDAKYTHAKTSVFDSNFALLNLGTDYLIDQGFLVGGIVQLDWGGLDSKVSGASSDGIGWMAGPYFVANPVQKIYLDGRILLGQSYNQVNPLGKFSDGFTTNRGLASLKISGNFSAANFTIEPAVEIVYFAEEQQSFVNSQNVTIPGQSTSLGTLIFGPRLAYDIDLENGGALSPSAKLEGLWEFSRPISITIDPLRARPTLGLDYAGPMGALVGLSGFYDSIGISGFEAYGAKLSVSVPLN